MATLDDSGAPAVVPQQPYRPPIVAPGHTTASVTDKISEVVLQRTPKWWFFGFAGAFSLLMIFLVSVTWLFIKGVGVFGINWPIGWGFDIINFVWWIGIGHAGTLISAILLLLRQEWRTSINRFAEAMTLFAVACAGMYPLLHLGRPWLAYWLFPYPNTMSLWPQFRSPLIWDVFAVSTYATVSALFWYVGLVPDLATLRDRARNRLAQIIYGFGAMGWRGSASHWHNYETAYVLLAGLATPLVLSVHTVVSFDFAIGIIPGWHATIFPPYFVAGAIYAGFAMVLTLAIPLRALFKLEDFITARHLQNMAKVMLATGLIVVYGYMVGAVLRLVQRQRLRDVHGLEPHLRTLPLALVHAAALQRGGAAVPVVPPRPHLAPVAVRHLDGRQRRHVARALRHHRHQPAPRLPAGLLGHLSRVDLGLEHVHRHHRPVPDAVLPLHPLPAGDLDLRDADDRPRHARRRVHGGAGMSGLQHPPGRPPIYGLMAEFNSVVDLIDACRRIHDAGFTRVDAFTPYPSEEVIEALGHHRSKLPAIVLGGGLVGGIGGYLLQYWTQVIVYPMNIGGRPFHSWPAFIVPTFECTILGAALAAVFGMFFLNGLPQPYHPVFNVPRFAMASRDRYFLVIEARDAKFDREATRRLLADLKASEVHDVAH